MDYVDHDPVDPLDLHLIALELEGKDDAEFLELDDQPEPGDYTITPDGPLGGRSALAIVEGRFVDVYDSDDEAIAAARKQMDEDRFWSNIWMVSDHGDLTLLGD